MVVSRLIRALLPIAFLTSCGQQTVSNASTDQALTDGFEVVVFEFGDDRTIENVRSLPLTQAIDAIAAGSEVWLPTSSEGVEQALQPQASGDSFVKINARSITPSRQRTRVSFHYSMRTYVYEYEVEGREVIPILSEYRDLSKSTKTVYSPAR